MLELVIKNINLNVFYITDINKSLVGIKEIGVRTTSMSNSHIIRSCLFGIKLSLVI